MLARIRKSMQEKDQGFTLIELLVVIIIIGILAAIAIPVFLNQRNKGYDAAAQSDLKNMATAQETVLTDTGKYTTAVLGSAPSLEASGFKATTGVGGHTAAVDTVNGSQGYCMKAVSQSGSSWWVASTDSAPSTTKPTVPNVTCPA